VRDSGSPRVLLVVGREAVFEVMFDVLIRVSGAMERGEVFGLVECAICPTSDIFHAN
jgi:hypothetical protein